MKQFVLGVVIAMLGTALFQNCQPAKGTQSQYLTATSLQASSEPTPFPTPNYSNPTPTPTPTSGTPVATPTPGSTPMPSGTPVNCKWEGALTVNGVPIYQVSPPDYLRQFCSQANTGGSAVWPALLSNCHQYAANIPLGTCNCEQWLQVCPNVK